MRKNNIFYVWAELCALIFQKKQLSNFLLTKAIYLPAIICFSIAAQAQDVVTDVISGGIKVGEKVPEITLNELYNYKTSEANLSDFKGKFLILDFWATWCKPCIAMIPKMERLQQEYEGKLQFISVTYQSKKEVDAFMQKWKIGKESKLPYLTDDKILHKLFPHIYLPHYIWIDGDGIVCAITGYEEVTSEKIKSLLNHQTPIFKAKSDLQLGYEENKLLVNQKPGAYLDELRGYNYFSNYIDGQMSGHDVYPIDKHNMLRITVRNLSIYWLYSLAFSDEGTFDKRNMVFELSDTTKLSFKIKKAEQADWIRKNTYCYEMVMPATAANTKAFYGKMKNDLTNYLPQYESFTEERRIKCLALVRTSKNQKFENGTDTARIYEIKATGFKLKNQDLSTFINPLASFYLQGYPLPVVDDTGISGKINLNIQANMNDVTSINQALASFELKLEEKMVVTKVLVVRDRK